MVGKDKTRITISLTKSQHQWLDKLSNKTGASISRLIRFLIDKDLTKLVDLLVLKGVKADDLLELMRVAKTPWLDDDGEL